MAEPSRLAGTLVGSILESSGYHYQEAILKAFQSPFENEIGGLIYILAIILAIMHTATRGGFKMGAWLLIGPPLFFAVIQVQQQIPNARWEFSLQPRTIEEEKAAREAATNRAPEAEAKVSTVFARYVHLVSEVTKSIVNTLSQGRENADLWFLIRAQLYAMMHTAEATEVGLIHLIHHGLLLECSEAAYWAQAIEDPLFREFDPNDPTVAAVAAKVNEAKEWFAPTKDYAQRQFDNTFYLNDKSITPQAARYIAALNLGANATEEEIVAETARLMRPDPQTGKGVWSCADIWRQITLGILRDAQTKHLRLTRTAEDHGIPSAVINNLLLQASGDRRQDPLVFAGRYNETITVEEGGQQVERPNPETPQIGGLDVNRIKRIIALYYLRNEVTRPDKGSWISYMANRHEARFLRTRLDGESSITERSRVSVLEWSEKERLIHNAASLPYYQGIILYFLGALFPFFALLLLIPGKHGGFLIWFSLWFWAKSWDIGFAIVMLLDDVLFALFAIERQQFGKIPELNTEEREIGVALASIRELDPSFQLSTYYTLVSVALMAVPIASAQIFLGAMAQGAGIIEKGARAFSDGFADSAHHHMVRDANTAFQNEASMLMKKRAQLDARVQIASARLATSIGSGLDLNANPNGQNLNAPIRSNQFESAQGSLPGPQVGPGERQAARTSASRSGFLQGATNKYEPFGGQDNLPDMLLAIGANAGGSQIDRARAEAITSRNQAALSYEAERLQWIAVHEQIRNLHMQAAPYGILPLPPTGFYPEPSKKELAMAYARFQEEWNMRIALISTYADMTKEILKTANSILERSGDSELTNLNQVNALNGQQKSLISRALGNNKRFMMLATGITLSGTSLANKDNLLEHQDQVRQYIQQKNQEASNRFVGWINQRFNFYNEPNIGQNYYRLSSTPEENFMVERNRYGMYELPDKQRPGQGLLAPGNPQPQQ